MQIFKDPEKKLKNLAHIYQPSNVVMLTKLRECDCHINHGGWELGGGEKLETTDLKKY